MKRGRATSRWLRHLSWLAPSVLAVAACERPDYTYSDDVPIRGQGAFPTNSAGATTSFAGSFTTGGTTPVDPCALDRSVSASPIFAKQALSNQLPVRPELYAQLTNAEVEALKKGGSLLPPPASPPVTSVLTNLLNSSLISANEERKPLLRKLLERFKTTRTLWPNPWALRLLDHPGTERMNPVRVVLKPGAWVVRIFDNQPPTIVDVKNGIVTLSDALAHPENIAAVYYVLDDRASGGSVASCETGKREIALGNENMVEEFSIGTPEILDRLNSDIDALTAFFAVVRPCASVERGAGTFHTFTVCSTWHFFDATTEYSAYQWALSNPMEAYKPKTQNLATLIDALKDDRFEPNAFVGTPPPSLPIGGEGGMGGMGGMGGATDAGAAGQGGVADGGSPP